MMRRAEAVVFATPERLNALVAAGKPVYFVAPKERASTLLAWIQTLPTMRVAVDDKAVRSHVIVRLEPWT